MPKQVHDLVDKLLADPDFYPKKNREQQEAIAWAIAYSKYNKSKGKSKKKKATAGIINDLVTYTKILEANSNYNEADALVRIATDLINDHSNNS